MGEDWMALAQDRKRWSDLAGHFMGSWMVGVDFNDIANQVDIELLEQASNTVLWSGEDLALGSETVFW